MNETDAVIQTRGAPVSEAGAAAEAPAGEVGVADDALNHVAALQNALALLGTSADGAPGRELARSVSESLDRIIDEHRGMADELISVYEQLGIIFEVTKKLSTVSDESEVVGLFVESLRRSFTDREVLFYHPAHPGEVDDGSVPMSWRADDEAPVDSRLFAAIRRACSSSPPRVAVETIDGMESAGDRASTTGSAEALIGPIHSGGVLTGVLVIRSRCHEGRSLPTPAFRASDMRLVEALTTFCGDVIRNFRFVREMRAMSIGMVRSLVSAVDQKDEYTCGHSLRVGYYATMIGRLLGIPDTELQMLQWAALLHDVGKIGIRDDVLKKQGKLTTEEFAHIKEHPLRSHRVVEQVPQLAASLDGILHHHERYDGSGYPAGLAGEEIPLSARIIQIADVFDALTSSRSYRPAYTWQQALEIMREESGRTVDPRLQAMFDGHLRRLLESDPGAWDRMVESANRFDLSMDRSDESVPSDVSEFVFPANRGNPP